VLGNIVRNKIKSQLGLDQCRVTISGAAPIARSLLDWYQTIGIEINEGYGLTEQLAYGTLNLPGKVRFGTVGQVNVLPENNVRISEDGEIQFKSTALMKGYYLEPEKTAETFTEDGWLKTGDRGEIDADGYLKITGRVKDVFKTSKGKFVQPVKIETKLARNTFIEQVCVMGSGHPQPFAMIELSEEARSRMPTMRREIANALINTLTDVNKELDHHEMLERIFVVKDNWTPDNGFTTPTLKIKRNVLEKHYEALAEKYRDSRIDFVWEDEER
jgi:long-chain acyl-CoA synthetase